MSHHARLIDLPGKVLIRTSCQIYWGRKFSPKISSCALLPSRYAFAVAERPKYFNCARRRRRLPYLSEKPERDR